MRELQIVKQLKKGLNRMLSKNNFNEKLRRANQKKDHFSIRKLTVGVASVLIGLTFIGVNSQVAHAADADQPAQTEEVAKKAEDTASDQVKEDTTHAPAKAANDVKETDKNITVSTADKTKDAEKTITKDVDSAKAQTSENKQTDEDKGTAVDQTTDASDKNQTTTLDLSTKTPAMSRDELAEQKSIPTPRASHYNVDDWDGTLDNSAHEYTLSGYHGSDKQNIYIPNTNDFINAGKIGENDKAYITKDLIQTITRAGATSITVDDQGADGKNKVYVKGNLNSAFEGSTILKSVDLRGLDTSQVTDMSSMFNGDTNLSHVDLSGIDTSHVTNMNFMFASTQSLADLDLSGLDTSSLQRAEDMFYNATGLRNVNLSGWNLRNLSQASAMFFGAKNLANVNLSGWQLPDNANTAGMFSYADGENIKNVDITNAKNITQDILNEYVKGLKNTNATSVDLNNFSLAPTVRSLKGLFQNMPNLKSVNLRGFDTSNITDMSDMFNGDTSLSHVDLSGIDTSRLQHAEAMFFGAKNLANVNLSGWQLPDNANTAGMFSYADGENIKNVDITNAKNITQDILNEYVKGLKNTNATSVDLNNFSLAPTVRSLKGLFQNMPNLKSVNLRGFDTSHITDMSSMFSNTPELTTITGIENLDTYNVTNMAHMFDATHNPTTDNSKPQPMTSFGKLTELDLSKWDTRNVTDMSFMFAGQTKLTKLGKLSNWDTSNVTNMAGMFFDLESLPDNEFDLTGWDTSKVTDMSYMLAQMFKQENMDFVNVWKTGKVTDMSYMFFKDSSLKKLDLHDWNVSSVGLKNTEQNYSLALMFADDTALTSVGDISHWNTENVHDTRQMFRNTFNLKKIDLSGWKIPKLQIAEGMFIGSGAQEINLNNWDFSNIKRLNNYGFVRPDGELRGVENMFKNLADKAVILMNKITLPDNDNAFTINDFAGNKPIVVIANDKDGKELPAQLAVNGQTWTDGHKTITGRQNSNIITYVKADNINPQLGQNVGQAGLKFIFTNLDALHDYFNDMTTTADVKKAIGNFSHDWDAAKDTENGILKTSLRIDPSGNYALVDLMTSKYELDIVDPTKTTETKVPTRTIIIKNPDGSIDTEKQTVTFQREVTKHFDGTKEYTVWTPTSGRWSEFDAPQYAGYDSYIDGVKGIALAGQNIDHDTSDATVMITYEAINHGGSSTPDIPSNPDNPTVPSNPAVPTTPKAETSDTSDQSTDSTNQPGETTDTVKPHSEKESTKPAKSASSKKKNNAVAPQSAVKPTAEIAAATKLVAPKNEQAINKGLRQLGIKKNDAKTENTLPQTGSKQNDLALLGLGLLALTGLGTLLDRRRRD